MRICILQVSLINKVNNETNSQGSAIINDRSPPPAPYEPRHVQTCFYHLRIDC